MSRRRDMDRIWSWARGHRKAAAAGIAAIGIVVLLTYASGSEDTRLLIRTDGIPDFKNASVLGNPGEKVLQGEEALFSRQQKQILDSQKQLEAEVSSLRGQFGQLQGVSAVPSGVPSPSPSTSPAPSGVQPGSATTPVRLGPAPDQYGTGSARDTIPTSQAAPEGRNFGFSQSANRSGGTGPGIVSFPVKTSGAAYLKRPSISLPTGSYVKGKLLTGVEAPEGKTYPVLLQLDFAFVIPNHKRLDLTGCFAIAKAQGDLSTERVQMQASKLSCVSEKGGFFEREINGFVADDADNSFAVMGSVNSKQDRVAAMAFLASVVSGIGKAIQQAQTTQQLTPLGGAQSIVTGDQAKYIGAGGVSDAASQVTQWYLKQAQNLLPTINVGSGQDIWIVMQDSVDLPKDYFTQNGNEGVEHASIYSHFTRILE